MSFSPAFLGRIHRLYTRLTNVAHASKPADVVLFITLACFMGVLQGCNGSDGSDNAPTARLTAMESPNVPGRMELDGTLSVASGERKLVSHTYTVKKPGYGRNRLWAGYHSGQAGPGAAQNSSLRRYRLNQRCQGRFGELPGDAHRHG